MRTRKQLYALERLRDAAEVCAPVHAHACPHRGVRLAAHSL